MADEGITVGKNDAGHNKSRHTPHWKVLPPGEFNGTIPKPLPVCSGSFTTVDVTVSLIHSFIHLLPQNVVQRNS